jgi:hypothetical protein
VPKEIHAILKEILEEHVPSYATVKNWVAELKRDFFTYDAPRPGRPKTVTTLKIIDHIWTAEALREVGPEIPERGSKTSTVPVV